MATNYNPSVVTDGLVFCIDAANVKSYPGSGNTIYDLSNNGHTADFINGAAYASSYQGAIDFDGSNDYVELDTDILLGSEWTLSVTFSAHATSSDWVRIFGHSNDSSDRFWGIWIPNSRLYILWQSYTGGGQLGFNNANTSVATLNKVYHLTITNTTSNLKTLYLDGVEVSSGTIGGTISYTGNTSKVRIGYAGFHTYHNGEVYQASIYNKALTAAEVKQNFEATRGRFGV